MVDLAAGAVVPGSARREGLDPSGSAGEILGQVVACSAALSAAPGERWGVAVPGPFDYERGIGLFAGVGKFEALYGTDVGKALMAGLPGPPGCVAFLNDAEAFAWGERLFGAAADCERCVFLTLGTGIGSAFLSGETIRRSGPGVPPEGRVDLLQIAGRPLEETVSTRAMEHEYARRTGTAPRGGAKVASLARAGDAAATTVLTSAFRSLGVSLRPYLAVFAPQALIVGGAMTGSWDLIGPAFGEGLYGGADRAARALGELTISVAANPADAALLGAAAYGQGWVGRPR
jgi:glucokinase